MRRGSTFNRLRSPGQVPILGSVPIETPAGRGPRGADRGDWILCQVTSNSFSDPSAVEIGLDDFASGALRMTSFARPSKLFTANASLIASSVGILGSDKFHEILDAVIGILEASRQP